jgi:hypothetical protein
MSKRERELLLQLERVELQNLKIVLNLKQSSEKITQTEIDYFLDKILLSSQRIKDLENSLDY